MKIVNDANKVNVDTSKSQKLKEVRFREKSKKWLFSTRTVNPYKAGRNDPCPCGSKKKYKKCCYESDYKKVYSVKPAPSKAPPVDNQPLKELTAAVKQSRARVALSTVKGASTDAFAKMKETVKSIQK